MSVCLTSIAYIGPKSRTDRPRNTDIGTDVAHVTVTRTPLSRSEGQRSRSQGRGILWRPPAYSLLISDREKTESAKIKSCEICAIVMVAVATLAPITTGYNE